MNIESNLLGITFAVLTPFDVLIETERAPILSLSSVKAIKHPFRKGKNFTRKILRLSDLAERTINVLDPPTSTENRTYYK